MSLRDTIEYQPTGLTRSKRTATMDVRPSASNQFRVEINPAETHGLLLERVLAGCPSPCILALSPDTSFVNKGRLSAILQWLLPKVSRLAIAEGSFLTRWNLCVIDGLSEHEAEQIAEQRHELTATRIAKIAQAFCSTKHIEVLDWPSVVRSPAFIGIRDRVESYSARTPSFEQGIDSVVVEYLCRMRTRGESVSLARPQLKLLRGYVFEELAMFVHLYQAGLHVEVYPGDDLEIMHQFAAGHFKDFPFDLSARTHISLRLSQ